MSGVNVLQLNHIQRQSVCEMNVKEAISETVTSTKWPQYICRALIKTFILRQSDFMLLWQSQATVAQGDVRWAQYLTRQFKRSLLAVSWIFFVADNTGRLRSKIRRCHLTPDVRRRVGLCLCVILSVRLSVHVIPTHRHLQRWATGGWPLAVWVWSPPPVKSNVDRESRTTSEY